MKGAAAVRLGRAASVFGTAAEKEAKTERQVTNAASDPALIRREIAKQGARDWQLTRMRLNKGGGLPCPPIEGYCSKQSISACVSLLFPSGSAVRWVRPFRGSSDGRPNRIIFRGVPYGGQYKLAEAREKEHGPFPHRGPHEGYPIVSRNVDPVNGGGDWICTQPDHWIFAGTGVKKGEAIPGLIGWEYHGDPPTDIPALEIGAEGTALRGGVQPRRRTATIYPGPKGSFVFNASTIWWCQDLAGPLGHWLPWSHWSRSRGVERRCRPLSSWSQVNPSRKRTPAGARHGDPRSPLSGGQNR